jgi:hypothetical protein
MTGKNRIMIYGPKDDGHLRCHEFQIAKRPLCQTLASLSV